MIPFQVENAVKCNGQADKQQGTANKKPTAETKIMSELAALSKSQISYKFLLVT